MRNINVSRGFRHLWYQRNNREYESPYTIYVLLCILLKEDNIINLSKINLFLLREKKNI